MIANRNDQCPCGSGKKYKKCCLKKEGVVQLNEVKEERFIQQKYSLVEKMSYFFDKNIPFNDFCQLQSEFNQRSSKSIVNMSGSGFFQFWLHFFKRFDNGLRGIEWFYEENKARLSPLERTMAENWTKLRLKLVQAIKIQEKDVLFEDLFTKERFTVPFSKENIAEFLPWYGTLGLLEPFENHFYFNGVSVFKGPEEIYFAEEKIREFINETGLSHEEVLMDYYPEILGVLLANENKRSDEEEPSKMVHEYTLEYKVNDEERLTDFLYDQVDIVVDKWEETEKIVSWIGKWRAYTDNEMNGNVYLGEVDASVLLKSDRLKVTCIEEEKAKQWKEKIKGAGDAVSYLDEFVTSIESPIHVKITNTLVHLDEDTPPYFALYAQNAGLLDIDVPIPRFDQYTIRELAKMGRKEAETWLRQTECSLYRLVMQQFGKVDVTADFNTIRKELGLPLSPFVTGGEGRVSSIESIPPLHTRPPRVHNEDIPYYEDLGFTPDTIDHFYTKDLIAFYKEKTAGKGEGTVRKYRNSLFDLREILEYDAPASWEECGYAFWERLLTKDFFDFNGVVSKSRLKDFLSTIKAFTKWVDQKQKTKIAKHVAAVIQETEQQIIQSVEFWNAYVPYTLNSSYHQPLFQMAQTIKKAVKGYDELIEGYFQIIKLNNQSIRVVSLGASQNQQYTISLSAKEMNVVEEGMILCGEIGKSNINMFELVHLDGVYPQQAIAYL
ncbi:SEC-C metal-binding domain-containing protein [Priestia abyssalis]|uniref:SEC-C metal-binding domain-containing protein n=1 Tax=Priestia abyssalis TaxID=1221450 RepID=UPI0009949399|nr:SEC-C metal-binding domain-containing protein [Priestia abyssalis]